MSEINQARISIRCDQPVRQKSKYVLYWMQQSQRAENNDALEFAKLRAAELKLPLLVCFVLTDSFPEANARHYAFMLEGLAVTGRALADAGISFVLRKGDSVKTVLELERSAAVLVFDRGYTRIQRSWRSQICTQAGTRVFEIESDVVVPVETASGKPEYMARTLRPKVEKLLPEFLKKPYLAKVKAEKYSGPESKGLNWAEPDKILAGLKLDRSVGPVVEFFKGGINEGRKHLKSFINTGLKGYSDNGGKPATGCVSGLAPYLHFGQISPLEIAIAVKDSGHGTETDRKSFLEQLIVRRELAVNFVWHRPETYDSLSSLPDWAKQTIADHSGDTREYVYDLDKFESALTHDPYWNAAMNEMRGSGYMHGHMRMYWGKKIIEWSKTHEQAFKIMLYLNNKYFLDGRDPNSFAGVLWCFGLHDQAWRERSVFGKLRYMNANGLRRKIDAESYVSAVKQFM